MGITSLTANKLGPFWPSWSLFMEAQKRKSLVVKITKKPDEEKTLSD